MLLPDPDSNIIMLATGTGIAPFRSFLRYLFHDKATKGKFQGAAWLFLGVPFSESLLYDEEWKKMQEEFPGQFKFDYAISDEQKRPDGGSMYVQHRVMEYIEDVWPMVKDKKTHVYMCGLKGMATGLEEAFGPSCEKEGINVKEFIKQLKKEHRYHVEVY
jgi:ferredoxin--NADP+ reductase